MPPQHQRPVAPLVNAFTRPSYSKPHAGALSSSKLTRSSRRSVCYTHTHKRLKWQALSHKQATIARDQRYPRTVQIYPASVIFHVRHKSSWESGPSRSYGWGWRLKSSWHHPGCKWVRSEGLLDGKAPRDRDCPACQEEQMRPEELSHRELVWRQKMEAMRIFIERDPYEALFGQSNRLLKGNFFPKSMTDSSAFPWWSREASLHSSGITKSTVPGSEAGTEINRSVSATQIKHANQALPMKNDKIGEHSVEQTKSALSPRSTPASSSLLDTENVTEKHTTVKKEDFQFDPITMRMVPASTAASDNPELAQERLHQHEDVPIPVKKFVPEYSDTQHTPKGNSKSYPQRRLSSQEFMKKRERDLRSRQDWLLREGFQLENMLISNTKDLQNPTNQYNFRKNVLDTCSNELALSSLSVWQALRSAKHLPVEHQLDNLTKSIQGVSRSLYTVKRHLSGPVWKASLRGGTQMKMMNSISLPTIASVDSNLVETSIGPDQALRMSQDEKTEQVLHTEQRSNKISPTVEPVQSTWISGEAFVAQPGTERKVPPEKRWKDKVQDKVLKFPLVEKEKPVAQISLIEIERHRENLLASWAKKHIEDAPTDAASQKLANEVNAQKAAMAAYEARHSNRMLDRSAISADLNSGMRDRAKNASVHPMESEEPEDHALVKNIQNIYERVYGTIDVNHQQNQTQKASHDKSSSVGEITNERSDVDATQSAKLELKSTVDPTASAANPHGLQDPALYLVLAYDPSNQTVYTANASSSFTPPTGETILSVSDSLARLHAPAKFIPLLAQHQAEGYDIVSASKHLLVFKRMRLGRNAMSMPTNNGNSAVHSVSTQPLDPQVGNFASPTGFVNHDSPLAATRIPASATTSSVNPVIRKEEPVFSGNSRIAISQDWRESRIEKRRLRDRRRNFRGERRKGRFRRALKRFLLLGGWTAACCYAMGVVMEYLRTGGSVEREERGWDPLERRRTT